MKSIWSAQSSPDGGASTLLTSELLDEDQNVRGGRTRDVATSVSEITCLFGYRLSPRPGPVDQILNRDSPSPRGDSLGEQSVAVPASGCITPAASVPHQRGVPPRELLDSKGWCGDPRAVIGRLTRGERVANPTPAVERYPIQPEEKSCIVI